MVSPQQKAKVYNAQLGILKGNNKMKRMRVMDDAMIGNSGFYFFNAGLKQTLDKDLFPFYIDDN